MQVALVVVRPEIYNTNVLSNCFYVYEVIVKECITVNMNRDHISASIKIKRTKHFERYEVEVEQLWNVFLFLQQYCTHTMMCRFKVAFSSKYPIKLWPDKMINHSIQVKLWHEIIRIFFLIIWKTHFPITRIDLCIKDLLKPTGHIYLTNRKEWYLWNW